MASGTMTICEDVKLVVGQILSRHSLHEQVFHADSRVLVYLSLCVLRSVIPRVGLVSERYMHMLREWMDLDASLGLRYFS